MTSSWGDLDDCGVCPACRLVVPDSRPCDLDGTVVRPIVSAEDKQVLVDTVWGPPVSRARLMQHLAARTATSRLRVISGVVFGAIGMFVATAIGAPPPHQG
jgi:hypothetical protein